MSGLRRLTIPLPSSDPASAIIVAWLESLSTGTEAAPLLRQALMHGIATTHALARIEARLDALAGGVMVPRRMPSPDLDTEEQALLGGLLDFSS